MYGRDAIIIASLYYLRAVTISSDHFARPLQAFASAELFRGRRKIVKLSWNSDAKRACDISFWKEVSLKRFCMCEGRLAEKLRFQAFNLHFWRKSRRQFCFSVSMCLFEGGRARMFCFWGFTLHVDRKSHRQALFLRLHFAVDRKSHRQVLFLRSTVAVWLGDWVFDWPTDSLTSWTDLQTNWLTKWQTEWHWLTIRLSVLLTWLGWLTGWLTQKRSLSVRLQLVSRSLVHLSLVS